MTRKRSKIRSKARSDSSHKSENEVLYCICRSSDGTRFMIACDNCEEWYHGDCINVTPKQANNIKRFFCHLCIGRNPSLEIEYKIIKENRPRLPNLRQQIKKINFSSEDENDADLSSSSTPEKFFVIGKNKRTARKRSRPSMSESVKSTIIKKRRGRPKEKPDEFDDEATEDEIETSGFAQTINDCQSININEHSENMYVKKSFRSQMINNNFKSTGSTNVIRNNYIHNTNVNDGETKSCGVGDGFKLTSNCGKCDMCKRSINSRFTCLKKMSTRDQKHKHQLEKDYTSLLDEDLESALDVPGFNSQDIHTQREYEIRQRQLNSLNPSKELASVGSKMRRGDVLPGGGNSITLRRGPNTTTYFGGESIEVTNGASYSYRRPPNSLSRNQNASQHQRKSKPQSDTAQISSNTSSVSDQLQYADDSDEDVMIPSLTESDTRNYSTSYNQHQRMGKNMVNSDLRKYQYGLSYPDHLYCKHHRFYNWHSSVSEDSISPDTSNCKVETNLKLSDKESEIHSYSKLRSPSEHVSSGNFVVLDRSGKQTQISSTGMRPKYQIKNTSSINSDRHGIVESYGTLYTESNQVYPIIDFNQQITNGIQHNSNGQVTIESNPHSLVFTKVSMANAQRQEFYTINDEDDLEINWPKETVNV